MSQRPDYDGAPADLSAAEIEEARRQLAEGEVVRRALPGGRLALCTSLPDVLAAQRGRIPHDAVRLDRGARR